MVNRILFAASLMVLAVGCTQFSKPPVPSVQGAVWLDRGNGESIPLRGLTVNLCDPDRDAMFKVLPPLSSFPPDRQFSMMVGDLSQVESSMINPDHCPYQAKTDVDGTFQIEAPAGEYLAVAIQQSPSLLAQWIVPISIPSDESLDLNHNNAAQLLKK